MPEQEYINELAISSSSVKDFKKMPPIEWKKVWITKEHEGKKSGALSQGSLTDDLLFNPKCVENKYLIMELKKPSDSVSYIIERIVGIENVGNIADYANQIAHYAKSVPMLDGKIGWGQGKGWNDQRIFDTVLNEGTAYFDFLKAAKGKCIVTGTEYMNSLMMAEAMKKSELVKPYLDPKLNKFQFQIVTDDDFPEKLKGCLDILHWDKKKKQIRVVDFKTADSAYYFIMNVIKFGYLEQMSFYNILLREWLINNVENYLDYAILPPLNIVMDNKYAVPYFYEYNWKDINAAYTGYFKYGKMQKGIKDWIKEIQWHLLNDKWDYPMEHYLYGNIKLNLIHHNE